MMKCKWAGDTADDYCKSCDGIKMMVEGIEKPCNECAGYEEGDEEVESTSFMNEPTTEEKPNKDDVKNTSKTKKTKNTDNTTLEEEKPEIDTKNKVSTGKKEVKKVSEEKKSTETLDGVKVVALRYTSSATVKRNDNYYKFTAEEEWNVSEYTGDVDEARNILWAKLNGEVDKQIEELNNM